MTLAVNIAQGGSNNVTFRNRIINGAMVIDQRNAGASVTPTATTTYTLDRWQAYSSQPSKYSVQQNAGSITPPAGFSNYVGLTSLSAYSVVTSDFFNILQKIEGFNTSDLAFGTASAKTITVSFWVYSSLTGTFGGAVQNSAQTRCYPFPYTISSANTWTQISVTIPGDTSGTWIGGTNGIGAYLIFNIGSGSSFSGTANTWNSSNVTNPTGAVSVVGTSGATFYITGVQLEAGTTASPFEYRQYGTELALCQRYYQKVTAADGGLYTNFGSGAVNAADNVWITYPLKTKMRVTPSMGTTGTNANYQVLTAAGATGATNQPSLDSNNSSTDIIFYSMQVSGGLTTGQACFVRSATNTSAYIAFSSEL